MLAACALVLLGQVGGEGLRRTTAVLELAGEPPRAAIEHSARGTGTVRIWVEDSPLDLELSFERGGRVLAPGDDSGGRAAPSLNIAVDAGDLLAIEVRSKSGPGGAHLVVLECAETADARALAADLRARLTAGSKDERRAGLLAVVARAVASPDLAASDTLQLALESAVAELADLGEHAAALSASERLCAAYRDVLAPDSTRRAQALVRLGNALGQLGRPTEAARAYEEAVASLRRTQSPTDPVLLGAESNRATALLASGAHAEAFAVWESVARVAPAASIADRRALATIRANMAVAAFYLGDLPRARESVEAARSTDGVIEPGSALDFQVRAVLAAIVAEQGDHRAGRVLAEEALAHARATLPPGHVDLAVAEANVAIAEVRAGEDLAARATFARLLADPPAGLASAHPLLVQSRLNLAAVDLRLDRPAEALASIEAQLAELGSELPRTHAVVRTLLRNRSLALAALGRDAELDSAESELLETARAALPPDHPERLRIELQRAWTLARLGRDVEARAAATAGATTLRDVLAARATILSAREAEASLQGFSNSIDLALASLLDAQEDHRASADVALAFELGETARGLALYAHRSARAAASGGSTVQGLRERARRAQIDLVRASRTATADELLQRIDARDEAERAWRDALGHLGHSVRPVSIEDVRRALSDGEVAVAWRVRRTSPRGDTRVAAIREIVTAIVVRADGTTACVELGPFAALDEACRAWRAELDRVPHERDAERAAGQRLRALVVDPLVPLAGDARRWIAAPDGALATVPLDALPSAGSAPDARLGDALRIVTTWSFATAAGTTTPSPAPSSTTTAADGDARPATLVLVGDPDFGPSEHGRPPRWAPLPATAVEIDALARLWSDAHAQTAAARVLRGGAATSTGLAASAASAGWLHIATHGAFAADEAQRDLLTFAAEDPAFDAAAAVRTLIPLVRCELALAGANASDDGLLNAEGVAALDLSACRLVVLSACDTGRGEIVPGLGVASFQRAAIAAGAQACATSLWRVPDEAARELMVAFYRGIWAERRAPEDALWRAKRELRDRRAPPRDWAGWVLATAFGSGAETRGR